MLPTKQLYLMSNEDVYEEYILDNDPRYLDIIALKNKPYIKVFEEERELGRGWISTKRIVGTRF